MSEMYLGRGLYNGESVEIYHEDGSYFIDRGKGLEKVPKEEEKNVYFDPIRG